MKKSAPKSIGSKSSNVIKPGTGSGSRPVGGKTNTPQSAPADKHGLSRAPKGALK